MRCLAAGAAHLMFDVPGHLHQSSSHIDDQTSLVTSGGHKLLAGCCPGTLCCRARPTPRRSRRRRAVHRRICGITQAHAGQEAEVV